VCPQASRVRKPPAEATGVQPSNRFDDVAFGSVEFTLNSSREILTASFRGLVSEDLLSGARGGRADWSVVADGSAADGSRHGARLVVCRCEEANEGSGCGAEVVKGTQVSPYGADKAHFDVERYDVKAPVSEVVTRVERAAEEAARAALHAAPTSRDQVEALPL
jgi:hypothetical protein